MKKHTLSELKTMFKGKGGGPEGESHVVDCNADKEEGYVSFYSTKADVAKVIDRCEGSIIDYELLGDSGVQFKIDRKAFRGLHCAFRRVK